MPCKTIFAAGYAGAVSTLSFPPENGTLELVASSKEAGPQPSWLTAVGSTLYATDESDAGTVTTFDISSDGTLQRVAASKTASGAVSSALTRDGKLLAVPTYMVGSLYVFSLDKNMHFSSQSPFQHFEFKLSQPGPNADRQDASHPHQAIWDPSDTYLMICDLGADKIHIFYRDGNKVHQLPPLSAPEGSGPRHIVFPPGDQKPSHFYSVQELSNEVALWKINISSPSTLDANVIQTLSTLNESSPLAIKEHGTEGQKASEIAISGQHLYLGNRGGSETENDSIAVYELADNGRMTFKTLCDGGGRNVRHFAIDTDGEYVAVGCQDDDKVVVLKRNVETGLLSGPVATCDVPQVTVAIWKP